MSRNHKPQPMAQPNTVPTLEAMLGTNVRGEQAARVQQLLMALDQSCIFVMLSINSLSGKPEISHTPKLQEQQLMALLNVGHQYLAEQKAAEAAKQQHDLSITPPGMPGQPFPDPPPGYGQPELDPLPADPGPVKDFPLVGELPPEPAEQVPPSFEQGEGLDNAAAAGG